MDQELQAKIGKTVTRMETAKAEFVNAHRAFLEAETSEEALFLSREAHLAWSAWRDLGYELMRLRGQQHDTVSVRRGD